MYLSAEQIAFFKTNGYLLVPGAMDLALCATVRDMMWGALPPDSPLVRDDPKTHVGPFEQNAKDSEGVQEGLGTRQVREGYRWLNRDLGVTQELIDLIYSDSICAMAGQLVGAGLRQAVVGGSPMGSQGPVWPGGPTDPAQGNEGARGVYCTLPYGDKPREADACHTDGHPFQLGVVGLLDATPQDGGAFKVWPRSHERLYPTFRLRYDQPRIPYYDHLPSFVGIAHSEEYLREIDALTADTPPVECWGEPGDIVFWHHRLAHMAGHNYSSTIRQAVLADFWTSALDANRAADPGGDMWRDWSPQVQNSDGRYSPEFAAAQRLTI